MACVTTGGKVLIHSPHESAEEIQPNNIKYLNLNRKITSITSGNLKGPSATSSSASASVPSSANTNKDEYDEESSNLPSNINPSQSSNTTQDHLFIGSESSLLSYNVERNSDQFFIDVADGVKSLAIGRIFNNKNSSVVLAGGNCSVIGYDRKGNEVFWTVTADNVSTLAILPPNTTDPSSSDHPYILVGSEDFELRLFQREDMIHELAETDVTTLLTPASSKSYAYGLNNGTIGFYDDLTIRKWRIKTKNVPTTLLVTPDLLNSGNKNLITGWKNGNITIRNLSNGEIIHKDSLNSPIAGNFLYDYRLIGKEELIFITESGEIVGYNPSDLTKSQIQNVVTGVTTGQTNLSQSSQPVSSSTTASATSPTVTQTSSTTTNIRKSINTEKEKELSHSIETLLNEKLTLYNELKNLEKITKNVQNSSLFSPSKSGNLQHKGVGNLPSNTSLIYSLSPDDKLHGLSIQIEANNDMVQIVNAIIIDPDLSILGDKDVLPFSPKNPSNSTIVTIQPKKYQQCSLRVQVNIFFFIIIVCLHV